MKKSLLLLCSLLVGLCSISAAPWGATGSGTISGNLTNRLFVVLPVGYSAETVQAFGYGAGTLGVQFYLASRKAYITNALAANVGSNILASITPGDFVSLDSILIHDVSADTYQRAWVATTNASGIVITNIYTTGEAGALSTQTLAAGDIIYEIEATDERRLERNTALTIGGTGTVWAPNTVGPGTIELVQNTSTLITNTFLVVGGTKP